MEGCVSMDISLEDVQLAIKILNEFMRTHREAQRVMRQLGVSEGRQSGQFFNMENIMSMAMNEAERRKGLRPTGAEGTEAPITELTQEELDHFRGVADKVKKEGVKPAQP
jgi:hypothetical protein